MQRFRKSMTVKADPESKRGRAIAEKETSKGDDRPPRIDLKQSKEAIKAELGLQFHSLSDDEFDLMAIETEGYSRDEIAKLVQQTIQDWKDSFYSATHFVDHHVRVTIGTSVIFKRAFIPCKPHQSGAFKADTNFYLASLFMPPVTLDHFLDAFDLFSESSTETLNECEDFNKKVT